jgi:hypothetical protein
MAALSGGDIVQASSIALATSLSAYMFYRSVGENPNPEPGTKLVFKQEGERSYQENQNVGTARVSENDPTIWASEHSGFMQAVSKGPLFAPMGTWHDNWIIDYPIPKPVWDYCIRFTPGHAIGIVATFGAHWAASNPAFYGPYLWR